MVMVRMSQLQESCPSPSRAAASGRVGPVLWLGSIVELALVVRLQVSQPPAPRT